MNYDHVRLVQQSFEQVRPIAPLAADLFYDRLFELDPGLRRLFKDDMSEQKHHLMTTLAFAVSGLDKPDRILPAVRQLGIRHISYGVQDYHYQIVGEALLWTLAQGLGAQFTDEVEAAWTAVYTLLATTMQAAARETAVA